MANYIRSAKSASDWTKNELLAFNISIKPVEAATFFGVEELPAPSVSDRVLDRVLHDEGPGLTKEERKFFQYLRVASSDSEESAVDDFAKSLLGMLDYDSGNRLIRSRKEMSFYMGGQKVDAKADITLMSNNYHLLVVQENKRFGSTDDPEPQLVAESIAAFAHNQRIRKSAFGVTPPAQEAIPGITMVGSTPIFYRTVVTESLLDSLVTLTYPSEETIVLKYIPPVPEPHNYLTQGMGPVGNRAVVFRCFEAFKRTIDGTSAGNQSQ
ncbi:hypothetical protein HGRIS_006524 [Hohenbuehelia grisea]|uniref:Uncharacterized protein n=1 Tax=Hohenbuehelia grisea TaxID=104357 RepID=A0ABR3J9B1_9AGAR